MTISKDFESPGLNRFSHSNAECYVDHQGIVRISTDPNARPPQFKTKSLRAISKIFTEFLVQPEQSGEYARVPQTEIDPTNSIFIKNVYHLNAAIDKWNSKVDNSLGWWLINLVWKIKVDRIPIERIVADYMSEHGVSSNGRFIEQAIGSSRIFFSPPDEAGNYPDHTGIVCSRPDGGVTVALLCDPDSEHRAAELLYDNLPPVDPSGLVEYNFAMLLKKPTSFFLLQNSYSMSVQQALASNAQIQNRNTLVGKDPNDQVVLVSTLNQGNNHSFIIDGDEIMPIEGQPQDFHVCSPHAFILSMNEGAWLTLPTETARPEDHAEQKLTVIKLTVIRAALEAQRKERGISTEILMDSLQQTMVKRRTQAAEFVRQNQLKFRAHLASSQQMVATFEPIAQAKISFVVTPVLQQPASRRYE